MPGDTGETDAKTAPGRGTNAKTTAPGPAAAHVSSRRARKPAITVRPFHELGRSDGCAAVIVVGERAGAAAEHECGSAYTVLSPQGPGGGAGRRKKGGQTVSAKTCRALAAAGHHQRLRLLAKLLEGPATYRTLQKVTRLKAGPLYHHVNQLRLAGLVLPKQRDLYELTRGGRNLVLVAMALGPVIRDSRRRPCPPA